MPGQPPGGVVLEHLCGVALFRLALRALESLGMEVVSNKRNKNSRALQDAPGKSVDRWVAVLRQRQA